MSDENQNITNRVRTILNGLGMDDVATGLSRGLDGIVVTALALLILVIFYPTLQSNDVALIVLPLFGGLLAFLISILTHRF